VKPSPLPLESRAKAGSSSFACVPSQAGPSKTRPRLAWCAALLLLVTACGHPAERALQGKWLGTSVENFDESSMAPATGWARGTSLEFSGRRLKVTLPAQAPRVGVYELSSIQDRTVVLNVLSSDGESSELELIVDDEDSLRWVMGEGRAMVLHRK
jgi:hypothetical protein